MSELLQYILIILGIVFGLLTIAGLLIFMERRLLALWQDRYGPNRCGPEGILQIAADMMKIFWKEDWIPPFADKPVFVLAPLIILITVLGSFAVVPFAPGIVVSDLNVGILFVLGMSSLAVYSVALAGWSSNNKYALMGTLRAVGQMIGYEVFMGLSLMGVVGLVGSFSLVDILDWQAKHTWFCFPQALGLFVFLIGGMAEMRRVPFDIPEAESELVAGYHTEYSGMKFAAFFLGEYIGMTLISSLVVVLFFGGGQGPWLPPIVWFLIKIFLLMSGFILIRGALPRPRYDQVIAFGWKVMLPLALLNLVVTGAFVVAGTE